MPGGLLLALAVLAAPPGAVRVVASREGFRPSEITVHKGETVRIALSSDDGEHCFALDAFRIEKRIIPGKTILVEVTGDRVGSFPFHCCLEEGSQAIHGELRVTD